MDRKHEDYKLDETVELPPKKIYMVLRKDPRCPGQVETLTIEAHKALIPEGTKGAVAFFDFFLHPDGLPGAELHRILFDVLDVEQVMRELSKPGQALVIN